MQEETKLSQLELTMLDADIVELHAIARRIEQAIGKGQLSDDLRRAADRLNSLLKRF